MPGYTAAFTGLARPLLVWFIYCLLAISPGCIPKSVSPLEQAQTMYYVRYDTFMVNNRSVRENLVMVPAYNEFRIKQFEQVRIPRSIPLPRSFQKEELRTRALESAIKHVLETRGLIYVTTLNTTTAVSYEGLVKAPFHIQPGASETGEQESQPARTNGGPIFSCTAQFAFSPLSFPNQWEKQKHLEHLKQKISDLWEILR